MHGAGALSVVMFPQEPQINKTLSTMYEKIPLSCWSQDSKRFPPIVLGCLPEVEVPVIEDDMHFGHRILRNRFLTNQDGFSLRTKFDSTRYCS